VRNGGIVNELTYTDRRVPQNFSAGHGWVSRGWLDVSNKEKSV